MKAGKAGEEQAAAKTKFATSMVVAEREVHTLRVVAADLNDELCTFALLCANSAGALASAIGSLNANISATNFHPLNIAVSSGSKTCHAIGSSLAIRLWVVTVEAAEANYGATKE